jgi:hypothetical protein
MIQFEAPALRPGYLTVDRYHLESMNLTRHLNGVKVRSRGFPGGSERVRFQEVIAAGLVKPGTNTLTFDTPSDDSTAGQLSDAGGKVAGRYRRTFRLVTCPAMLLQKRMATLIIDDSERTGRP